MKCWSEPFHCPWNGLDINTLHRGMKQHNFIMSLFIKVFYDNFFLPSKQSLRKTLDLISSNESVPLITYSWPHESWHRIFFCTSVLRSDTAKKPSYYLALSFPFLLFTYLCGPYVRLRTKFLWFFFFLFEGNFCQTQCLICAIVPLPFEETKFLSVITLSVTLPSESCFQYQLGTQKGNSAAYRCSFSWYIPLFVLKSSGILQTCLPGCCLCWLSRDRCLCAVSPFFHLKGRVLPNKPFVKS